MLSSRRRCVVRRKLSCMSRHEDRQKMALESGATAFVAERGQEGIAKVREILSGGADAALECVGTEAAVEQARRCPH